MVHPDDAAREGWSDDHWLRVESRAGAVEAPIEITDAVMPGVVSLPHGYGHALDGVRAEIAAQHAGVSCNDVTDALYLDPLSGNAAVNGVPVAVAACQSPESAVQSL